MGPTTSAPISSVQKALLVGRRRRRVAGMLSTTRLKMPKLFRKFLATGYKQIQGFTNSNKITSNKRFYSDGSLHTGAPGSREKADTGQHGG